MLKVNFQVCSIREEKQIIESIEKNIDFFKSQKIPFILPKKSVEEEFDEKIYKEFFKELIGKWQKEKKDFLKKVDSFFNLKSEKEIIIKITGYGCGGFYDSKTNEIFINKNLDFDFIRIIKHEIIHLIIEPYIEEFKINHKQKEQIVNQIAKFLEQ
ncbi:MAG: hypothetical protein PHW50_02110 [Patescibacteria group bacterium]|nr:hypothetical protein [Patescibacteria group bacterium]